VTFVAREFNAGDVLIFQLESGFGLLKVLAIEEIDGETIWHLLAYEDLFLDPETADLALASVDNLRIGAKHLALTNRAFESTQTARMTNFPVTDEEFARVKAWQENPAKQISDTSVRLLLGLR
jgi:hypothetical protein